MAWKKIETDDITLYYPTGRHRMYIILTMMFISIFFLCIIYAEHMYHESNFVRLPVFSTRENKISRIIPDRTVCIRLPVFSLEDLFGKGNNNNSSDIINNTVGKIDKAVAKKSIHQQQRIMIGKRTPTTDITSYITNKTLCFGLKNLPRSIIVRWIHLKTRKDRKLHMKRNILPAFNKLVSCLGWIVEEISACCFSLQDYLNENITKIHTEILNISNRSLPEIRILRSHARAVKYSSTTSRHVFILEDDVKIELDEKYFIPALIYIFSVINESKWDILKMGYYPNSRGIKHGNIRLRRGCEKRTSGAFAYVVNRNYRSRYYQKLETTWMRNLRNEHEKNDQADNIMYQKMSRSSSSNGKNAYEKKNDFPIMFHIEPRIFGHIAGWSDNWGKNRSSKRLLSITTQKYSLNTNCSC